MYQDDKLVYTFELAIFTKYSLLFSKQNHGINLKTNKMFEKRLAFFVNVPEIYGDRSRLLFLLYSYSTKQTTNNSYVRSNVDQLHSLKQTILGPHGAFIHTFTEF